MKFEFDNTLQVKQFAQSKEAKALLNIPVGKEKQLFKAGDKVTSTEFATYNLNGKDVTVKGVEEVNGYYRYTIHWSELKAGCKKKTIDIYESWRQKDLKLT